MAADTLAGLVAGDLPAPGSWRAALYRPDAPGAVLDSQPWARSWAAFLAAVLGDDPAPRTVIANAMSERVPSEGGFLVPENLRSQALAYLADAVVRPRAMVLPMSSLRLPVPTLDNPDQQAGKQALGGLTFAVTEEGAAITAATPAFGRATLEARKIAGLLEDVPNELVDDAAGPFGDFLARVVARGYGWYEDDRFIANGTGAGEPQSLLNAPCALPVTRDTSSKVLHLDIVAMLKALHPASKAHGVFLLSSDAFDQLLELYEIVGTAPSGQDIPPPQTLVLDEAAGCWRLLGVRAYVTDHQPAVGTAGDCILADLRHYLIGDRLEMTVERSAKGAGFVKGTSNFRIRSRVDGRYWVQGTSTTQAGQTVSPVVVLD